MNASSRGRRRSAWLARRKWILLLCALLGAPAIRERPAQGAMLPSLLNGGVIDAGNSRFSDWQLVLLDSTMTTPPDLALIEIVPLVDAPMHPGVQFIAGGQLATSGVNSIDLALKFRVNPLPGGAAITGHALALTGVAFGGNGGIVYVSGEVADPAGGDLGPAVVIADNPSSVFQSLATGSFSPQSGISMTMDLFITSLASADSASLDMFTLRVTQVPEPDAGLLALAALSLLALVRARVRVAT